MVNYRSNKGVIIDFAQLLAEQGDTPAVGNMKVDAKGNVRDSKGNIVKTAETRVREYYRDNPTASKDSASIKGAPVNASGSLQPDSATPEVKTAKTAAENVRTQKQRPAPAPQPEPVVEPDEFDAPQEPVGYKEVQLPNGDIEMVPIYKKESLDDGQENK